MLRSGEIHRTHPDFRAVDNDELVMHQTFALVSNDRDTSLNQRLRRGIEHVVAFHNHAHLHTAWWAWSSALWMEYRLRL